jgi:hypothetical protein
VTFQIRRRSGLIAEGKWPTCQIAGCAKPADGATSKWCMACRTQLRRTGAFGRKPHKGRTVTSHGYATVVRIGHLLAGKHGRVYEHRIVLHEAIGDGPHSCHWCGADVGWKKGACSRGSLVPDHLDGNKLNNAVSNLVPSCNPCNATRGLFMAWVRKHADDPWLWQMYEDARRKVSA